MALRDSSTSIGPLGWKVLWAVLSVLWALLAVYGWRIIDTLDAHTGRLAELTTSLTATNAKIDLIDARLSARIDGTNARIDGTNGRIDTLDKRMDRMETRLDRIDAKVAENSETLARLAGAILPPATLTLTPLPPATITPSLTPRIGPQVVPNTPRRKRTSGE